MCQSKDSLPQKNPREHVNHVQLFCIYVCVGFFYPYMVHILVNSLIRYAKICLLFSFKYQSNLKRV